jgi:chemotaxis protein MotB
MASNFFRTTNPSNAREVHVAPSSSSLACSKWRDDDANWWMITLSDLTLLLLGFVVCWYVTQQAKVGPQTAEVQARSKRTAEPKLGVGTSPGDESWPGIERELKEFLGANGLAGQVSIETNANEILLSLRDTVPFASGQAILRDRALPILEKLVSLVIGRPSLSVAISGHTDSLRIATPEFPSNWELSAARASRVARYFVERGVHPGRIAVQGYADRRPRQPNTTPANRSLNRRVEIRLFHENPATENPVEVQNYR